jgi:NADPH:quinone reductase-like Zn-dependent oxidoreductase
MKIAMLHGPRDLRIEEHHLDTSSLKADEVWVETQITAFKIGTDRGNYEGAERVPGAPDYPRWVGDSNLGIVRGVGSDVKRFRVGDRVVTRQPHQSEYIVAQDAGMVRVPAGVHAEDAVYTNLYALSAHCYRKALFQPGENVAVLTARPCSNLGRM